jgi:two-component system nitrogen regulation sensor histidine kinase NtrY
MPPRGSFERRLLLALVFFSVVPSLLLLGLGAYVVSESVSLTASAAAWERVADSGRELLEEAERSGSPDLAGAAARHRTELSASLLQSRRWEYVIRRSLGVIPAVAVLLGAILVWLAIRAARGIARGLAQPIHELVGWSERIAREEPLPSTPDSAEETGEFGILRNAFRAMSEELAVSRARALEAERMRTWMDMARLVAHELKNPLTPMRLAVHSLERSIRDDAPAREALEVIAVESARLEELARAFAQFGRLPEGPPSEIDLSEMLEYLLRTHLPPSVTHRLRAPVGLPLIRGHHDALSRAFSNLLLNAADAMGAAGGTVTIKMTMTGGDAVDIRILDTGPGIPPAQLDRIWEPDFTTKSRGTGLGLALVRQTVQAHGGQVWARNRPEGGAEFRVVLPVDSQAANAGDAAQTSGRNAAQLEIVDLPGG